MLDKIYTESDINKSNSENVDLEVTFEDKFKQLLDGDSLQNAENKDCESDSPEKYDSMNDTYNQMVNKFRKMVGMETDDISLSSKSEVKDSNNQDTSDVQEKTYDYDENGTRELTDEEKQKLTEALGWSDKKIEENCRIDENGKIHYKTDCQDKEGTASECGVMYVRKTIVYNGVEIEGVFPEFDSNFDTYLEESDYQSSSTKQFSECNKKLKEAIENDPDLKSEFTDEQLKDIEEGRTPRGYTWHHSEEPGKMQLVKTEEHDRRIGGAAHTGGNSIWGNNSIEKTTDNTLGGERF